MSETTAPQAAEPTKKSSRKRLLLLVGALTLVVMVAGGWWAFGLADATEPPSEVDGEIVALEPQTTTVGERGLNHARVNLAVVLTEDGDPEAIPPRVALLQDALLKELAATDADTLRGSEGSERLRARLSEQAQDIWGQETVRRVVLTELMVQ